MIETLDKAIHIFNDLTPLGLAGLLGYVIFLLVAKRGPVKQISENHLHVMPDVIASLERMEETLGEIRDGINYLKGRLNGKAS